MARLSPGDSSTSALAALYPALAGLSPALAAALAAGMQGLELPAGTPLFAERSPCQGFPLLLKGRIKVVKTTAGGREMVLYRVEPGGSCLISASCLLGQAAYSARGVAETVLTLCVLPVPLFNRLLAEVPAFRDFVFHLFAERIAELMLLVEEVAFTRLDQRLARHLWQQPGEILHVTHQQLAEELGSVREIVSRLLKGFAVQGLLRLSRERIVILDRAGLAQLAAPPDR